MQSAKISERFIKCVGRYVINVAEQVFCKMLRMICEKVLEELSNFAKKVLICRQIHQLLDKMRKRIAAGNWKMHLDPMQAQSLVSETMAMVQDEYAGNAAVIFAPSFPYLTLVQHLTKGNPRFQVAAQNVHQAAQGAFTGEVSAPMLRALGIGYCLVGHSERRQYFGEKEALLAQKVDACLGQEIVPIFCVGETLEERENGTTFDILRQQVSGALFHLSALDFGKIILAYEPVWAIGTGKTASPEQAQEVHAFIRQLIHNQYDAAVADNCSILYGGSVNAANAAQLFGQADIDGGLVGGASLKSRDFTTIVKAL
jgi:triosephosphate isomerase (TIM)